MFAGFLLALTSSCASYATPGRGANMALFEPSDEIEADIAGALDRKPAATFPAHIAVVRVQATGYRSASIHRSEGTGRFSVVTVRDIETDEDFERLTKLPLAASVAPLNRLIASGRVDGAESLRRAAAEMHADLVLVYTIDTVFRERDRGGPLTLLSVGMLPTVAASVDSTASAVLLDTRTGYVHAIAEATHSAGEVTNAWWSSAAIDTQRLETERKSFGKLLDEFERAWGGVIAQQAAAVAAPETAAAPAVGN